MTNTMLLAARLFALGLLAASSANGFAVDGVAAATSGVYPLSPSLDLRILEDAPMPAAAAGRRLPMAMPKRAARTGEVRDADEIDDIDEMSMDDLSGLLMGWEGGEGLLAGRETLEEARDIVWEHVVHSASASQSSPCCPDFPFCGCPKTPSSPCCDEFPFCGCPKL